MKKLLILFLSLPIISGCSFFESSVQTCNEEQEYEQSSSIPNLVVPDMLRELQNRSRFSIPESTINQSIIAENKVVGEMLPAKDNEKSIVDTKPIDEDELSQLLGLIDQTIDNRNINTNRTMVYQELVNNSDNKQLQPCLEEAPNYFADGILEKKMPSQNYENNNRRKKNKKRSLWQRITGRNKDKS